jgi:hypothetical protein
LCRGYLVVTVPISCRPFFNSLNKRLQMLSRSAETKQQSQLSRRRLSELPLPAHSAPALALRIQRRVHIKRTLRPGRGMRYWPRRLADFTFSLLRAWPVAFEVAPSPLPLHDRRLLCVGDGMGARRRVNAHHAAVGAAGASGVEREFGGERGFGAAEAPDRFADAPVPLLGEVEENCCCS